MGSLWSKNIHGLLIMREIKTAGYWFVYACLCTQTESGSVNTTKKKERGQYPPILAKQGWSMNYNLFYGKKKTIFLRDTAGYLERSR